MQGEVFENDSSVIVSYLSRDRQIVSRVFHLARFICVCFLDLILNLIELSNLIKKDKIGHIIFYFFFLFRF